MPRRRRRTSPFGTSQRRGSGSLGTLGRPRRRRARPLLLLAPLLVAAGALYYWQSSGGPRPPLEEAASLADVPPEVEVALGAESYRRILASSPVVRDGPLVDALADVGPRLAAVAAPRLEWTFTVVDSDEANAFCLPGGEVVVTAGIAPLVDTPERLAVVVAHAIAHAMARHGGERLAAERGLDLRALVAGGRLSGMPLETSRVVMGAFGVGARHGVLVPFSREHESEADYMSLIYLARACLDPAEAPTVWERLERAGDGSPPEIAVIHPSDAGRRADVARWMDEALAVRRRRCAADSE